MSKEIDMEARNNEHKIAEVLMSDAAVYFYRGWLRVDDEGSYYVGPGHGIVVEVYDRCETSVWLQASEAEMGVLAATAEHVNQSVRDGG